MTKMLRIALTIAVMTMAASAWAGGAFDGTWNGSVEKGSGGSCKDMLANVTVAGNQVTGSVKHHSNSVDIITGTIADDGTFEGKAGTSHVKGTFSGNNFEGIYKSSECGDRKFTMSR